MKMISDYLEEVIEEIGGFGKFQVFFYGSIFFSKVFIIWSFFIMVFVGVVLDWWCVYFNIIYIFVSGVINYNIIVLFFFFFNVMVLEMMKLF